MMTVISTDQQVNLSTNWLTGWLAFKVRVEIGVQSSSGYLPESIQQ